jgi:UDP-3-O-[3-hydroxymyristoyl] glucosamine N-acyltransferase
MKKALSLSELSELTGSELLGNPDHLISGIDTLEAATASEASFLANAKYLGAMRSSKAGVVCIAKGVPTHDGGNFLICENPSLTFQKIAQELIASAPSGFEGIHPTAVIHPEAKIGEGTTIGPYAVIDRAVKIGPKCHIGPFVSIGAQSTLGEECLLYAHSVVREACTLGNRVILQPGAVIGSCGFGYVTDRSGHHIKLEQLGDVVLGDDVEIGANTTIDRARFKTTHIHRGSKIDNLVQIGHNVSIGEDNIIVSQTGIAGSTKTGKHVIMGGQAGIVGHIEIADNVLIATRGGVSKSIKQSGTYAGEPVMPLPKHNRMQVHLRKIDEYAKKIEQLDQRLLELEAGLSIPSSE